jgi:hypothetical protein
MPLTEQERKIVAAAQWSGMSAVLYVTDPECWPGFAAFAEQWLPGSTWGEADRLRMREEAKILRALAERAER